MSRSIAGKIKINSFADLVGGEQNGAVEIPLKDLRVFKNHPFRVLDDEKMEETVESVKEYGVLVPGIARPLPEGGYELISGHRRKRACELAGMDTLRCEVVDMGRDEATIMMVESNFQRSNILPSEKAFAYKMRMDALSRQGKRTDLTSTPVVSKFRSNEIAGKELGESREQVRRYIRLTELVPELRDNLIKENDLRPVVFHSLRHSSTTYKLKISGGDIKAVQGDTGHAEAAMITERYAHILDDDRRVNAEKFEEMFYQEKKQTEETDDEDIEKVIRKLKESPELFQILKSLTK